MPEDFAPMDILINYEPPLRVDEVSVLFILFFLGAIGYGFWEDWKRSRK